MKWAVISTWKMSYEGNLQASDILKNHGNAEEAVLRGIGIVEDDPSFHSVGYSGLPDIEGHVRMDAGFMHGRTLSFGAVGALEGFRSPVQVVHKLAERPTNNFLVGEGAAEYARKHGFEERDNLTDDSYQRYLEESGKLKPLSAYKGHDTVGFVALDRNGDLVSATSTSGLFLKDKGRLGDSPVIGCGFYADNESGAAAATGLGEDIAKGVLCYQVCTLMKNGYSAQSAASQAVNNLTRTLTKRRGHCDSISLICMDKEGNIGVGTNIPFAFVCADDTHPAQLYLAEPTEGDTRITLISASEISGID